MGSEAIVHISNDLNYYKLSVLKNNGYKIDDKVNTVQTVLFEE